MRFVLALAVIVFATSTAWANEWTTTGQACMPDNAAVQNNLYLNRFGGDVSMGWNSGKTGTITLQCPIPTGFPSSPTHIELYFKNDASCSGCSADVITVQYIKMTKSNGVLTAVTTLRSSAGTNNGTYQAISAAISDAYSPDAYVYYVRVDMFRASGSTNTGQKFYMSVVY